jgi:hypothetical protein
MSKLLSDWTIAPILEFGSGRPFAILTGADTNFDFVQIPIAPMLYLQGLQPIRAGMFRWLRSIRQRAFFRQAVSSMARYREVSGETRGRGPGRFSMICASAGASTCTAKPRSRESWTFFNVVNRFNVADVNPHYTQAGTPTAAFDPRQLQLALKLRW